MSSFEDKNMTCEDCGAAFVWTVSEQEFYQERGFENAPKRCTECRAKRKTERSTQRVETPITCSECGKEDTVPFVPSAGRPVLCRDCFAKNKQA